MTPTQNRIVGQVILLLFLLLCLPAFGEAQFAPGKVVLIWTAPGDDNYTGQATGYDIRYQSVAIGPLDTENEWILAETVEGEPSPSPAGVTDSMEIGGLGYAVSYYFCIRAYDQAGNYSPMSNSPVAVSGDYIECPYEAGDLDRDGNINIFDATFLIKYLYLQGDPPDPAIAADINASGESNIHDIVDLLSFLYYDGDPPECVYE